MSLSTSCAVRLHVSGTWGGVNGAIGLGVRQITATPLRGLLEITNVCSEDSLYLRQSHAKEKHTGVQHSHRQSLVIFPGPLYTSESLSVSVVVREAIFIESGWPHDTCVEAVAACKWQSNIANGPRWCTRASVCLTRLYHPERSQAHLACINKNKELNTQKSDLSFNLQIH